LFTISSCPRFYDFFLRLVGLGICYGAIVSWIGIITCNCNGGKFHFLQLYLLFQHNLESGFQRCANKADLTLQ